METKFSKGVDYYNNLINQVEFGSSCYKLLVKAKHKYIKDF